MMKKKILAFLLAAVMVLALVACGGNNSGKDNDSQGGGEGGKTIGVCIYKFDDAFMTTYRNALQEILEGKGYSVTVVDGNNDQNKQNEQINTFITQGVDALIINPVMTSASTATARSPTS